MSRGHDQLLKDLIRAFPADLLTLMIPDVARHLRLDQIVFQPEEHHLDQPRGRLVHLDLVARVPTLDDRGGVIIHVENELRCRNRARLRLLCLQKIAAHGLDKIRRFLLFNFVATYLQLEGRAAEEFEILLNQHGHQRSPERLAVVGERLLEVSSLDELDLGDSSET